MLKKISSFFLLVMALVLGFSGISKAAPLQVIGTASYGGNDYNLIYEQAQGLVWLDYTKDAFYPLNQVQWADGLNQDGIISYVFLSGYTIDWGDNKWRLPSAGDNPEEGYYKTSSEMGHLFYQSLGNKGYLDTNGNYQTGWGLTNKGPFNHLLSSFYYSGTLYKDDGFGYPYYWVFDYSMGSQYYYTYYIRAMAVRSAQVSYGQTDPIPEPGTIALLGIGLAGLGLYGYRRRSKA